MRDYVNLTCPHCGEQFPLALDRGEGDAEFSVDCEVCCRPMSLVLRFGEDGELEVCEVMPE